MIIDPDDNGARYNAACTYAQLGEPDRAIDLLHDMGQATPGSSRKTGSCMTRTSTRSAIIRDTRSC